MTPWRNIGSGATRKQGPRRDARDDQDGSANADRARAMGLDGIRSRAREFDEIGIGFVAPPDQIRDSCFGIERQQTVTGGCNGFFSGTQTPPALDAASLPAADAPPLPVPPPDGSEQPDIATRRTSASGPEPGAPVHLMKSRVIVPSRCESNGWRRPRTWVVIACTLRVHEARSNAPSLATATPHRRMRRESTLGSQSKIQCRFCRSTAFVGARTTNGVGAERLLPRDRAPPVDPEATAAGRSTREASNARDGFEEAGTHR